MGNKLMLHVDSTTVAPEELEGLEMPPATKTFQPVPHSTFHTLVGESMQRAGLRSTNVEVGLSAEEEGIRHRYFGLWHVQEEIIPGTNAFIGARQSLDKTMAAKVGIGSRVFVCDNRSFIADFVVTRKHTSRILEDLPGLIDKGVEQFFMNVELQKQLFGRLKNSRVSASRSHDIAVQCAYDKVIPFSKIPKVLHEFQEPQHTEFKPRNGWSLFNSFTEVMKGYAPQGQVDRSLKLSKVFMKNYGM